MKLRKFAAVGMPSMVSILLIGSVAYAACNTEAGGSPPITSQHLSVVLSANGATGNGTPNITLLPLGPTGSSFMTAPELITITNNGTMTATGVALQLSDHHTNTTLEGETWACFYSAGNVLFNEPLTTVEGYGQSAIAHLTLAPGATDTYTVVYYAGSGEKTGCGSTFTGYSAVSSDGYSGQYNSTELYSTGTPNVAALTLTNHAEGGTLTPIVTVSYVGTGSVITEVAPLSNTTTTVASSHFKDRLETSGQNGNVNYAVTSSNIHLHVSSSGAITTTGTLSSGKYTVSGTDADSHDGTGTWSYTLTVNPVTIVTTPTSGTVGASASSAFTATLVPTVGTYVGNVNYAVTSSNTHLHVSSSGAMTTTGTLSSGKYTISGTDDDSYGDTGAWNYTLTVNPVTIVTTPTSGTVDVSASGAFTATLVPTVGTYVGSVSYVVTSSNTQLHVSSNGAITTTGTLSSGKYTVSGTDADTHGGTGTWSYTLTVTARTINCTGPDDKTVNSRNSGGSFSDQITASGWSGSVNYVVTSSNTHLHVSSNGEITTTGTLSSGKYTVSGTDHDSYGDTGSWNYTLTVTS